MSTGPPKPTAGISFGSPPAKVVVAPVLGSARVILPAAFSVTYSAPSGPMVLPEPPSRPATKRWAVGSPVRGVAPAAAGATNASNVSSRRTSHPDRRGVLMRPPSGQAVSSGSDGERLILAGYPYRSTRPFFTFRSTGRERRAYGSTASPRTAQGAWRRVRIPSDPCCGSTALRLRCRRHRVRALPCLRVGAHAARPYERRPRRPCHYRAMHSGPDWSPADNHEQHHSSRDLRG